MKPRMMAVLPLILFGSACGTDGKLTNASLDPAVLASCPRTISAPAELVAQEVLVIPDGQFAGMRVVPEGNANSRENALAAGAVVFKDGYEKCKSVVIYVEDRDRELGD